MGHHRVQGGGSGEGPQGTRPSLQAMAILCTSKQDRGIGVGSS
jgi:hypothetical protein